MEALGAAVTTPTCRNGTHATGGSSGANTKIAIPAGAFLSLSVPSSILRPNRSTLEFGLRVLELEIMLHGLVNLRGWILLNPNPQTVNPSSPEHVFLAPIP